MGFLHRNKRASGQAPLRAPRRRGGDSMSPAEERVRTEACRIRGQLVPRMSVREAASASGLGLSPQRIHQIELDALCKIARAFLPEMRGA